VARGVSAWPICGNCRPCLGATHRLLRVPPRRTLLPGSRPTAAALEKHAARFGPDQVTETAAEYGLSVVIQRAKAPRRASRPSLKTRVRALLADGHGVDVIAEIEDLSPARARRLVEELS
jgi:hypothetical protein